MQPFLDPSPSKHRWSAWPSPRNGNGEKKLIEAMKK
jgi:hypothetical protein